MSTTIKDRAGQAIAEAETHIRNARARAKGFNTTARNSIERGAVAEAAHGLLNNGWTKALLREHLTDGHGYLHVTSPDLKRWVETDEPRELGVPLVAGQSIEDLADLAARYTGKGDRIDAIVEAAADIGAALMRAGVIEDIAELVFMADDGEGGRVPLNAEQAAELLAEHHHHTDKPAA